MRSSGERTDVYITIYRDSESVESTRGGSLTLAPTAEHYGASVREVADGTKNADSAGLNRFPIWPATFARSDAHAQ